MSGVTCGRSDITGGPEVRKLHYVDFLASLGLTLTISADFGLTVNKSDRDMSLKRCDHHISNIVTYFLSVSDTVTHDE